MFPLKVTEFHYTWYFWPTLTIFALIGAALVLLGIGALLVSDEKGSGAFCLLAGLAVFGVIALVSFPWDQKYHGYSTVQGEVQQVSKRMLDQTEKYVVIIDNQAYGCMDTRCSLIQPGDDLTINCRLNWDYNGTDGWDCKWVRDERDGEVVA